MIVVTTPMCKQIVEWAGLKKFKVNKFPDEEEGDFAILLSESKVKMDSLAIKRLRKALKQCLRLFLKRT